MSSARRLAQRRLPRAGEGGSGRRIWSQQSPQPGSQDPPSKPQSCTTTSTCSRAQGGNMALQTGPEGNILIDASFAPRLPAFARPSARSSKDAPDALINTHWHCDHTDGNEGLHSAGFTIFAHQKTRERLSTPQTMKAFHVTLPARSCRGLPTITFDDALHVWHNGDSSIWFTLTRRTPTPTFTFTSTRPMCCTWATSGSMACIRSSTKAPVAPSAA